MMAMSIKLDEARMERDHVYDPQKVWAHIDEVFEQTCTKERQADGTVMYFGDSDKEYYSCYMIAVARFEECKWFAQYCTEWIWYDNDDDEDEPLEEYGEDVLEQLRETNPMFREAQQA